MNEEEKQAIETLKEVASDDFDTLGDDISPKMAQNILNVIDKQQKEIEKYEQQIDLEFVEKNFIEKNKVVSKDKIKEKLNQINNEYSILLSNKSLSLERQNNNAQRHEAMRVVLEELLEEN